MLNCRRGGGGIKSGVAEISNFDKMGGGVNIKLGGGILTEYP